MPQIAGFRGVIASAAGVAAGARDATRCVYRYHQVFAGPGRAFTRKNLIVAVRLAPWSEGVIRPHEATVPALRDTTLAQLRTAAVHTDPVVMGFRDPPEEVERLMRKVEGGTPTLERTTPDGTAHRIWRVHDNELLGKLRHYFAPKKLHVLEGHTRYEAMLAYQEELAGKQTLASYSSANYALACLVNLSDPTLVTAARHRILRGAIDRDAALATARASFIVDKLAGVAKDVAKLHAALADTVAHQPGCIAVFAGDADAYRLTLSPDVSPFAEGVAPHRALQKLDPVVVDGMLVARALPGATVTTETDAGRALAALDAGAGAVLLLRALSVEQIAHVDELGQLLPAGSTALHPPIAPGLVGLVIDPDEDLV